MVQLSTLQPLRLPAGRWIAAAAWGGCAVLLALAARQALPQAWWWTQAGMLGCGVLTLLLMTWSYRLEPHPFALLLRRLAAAATATLLLLSAGGGRGQLARRHRRRAMPSLSSVDLVPVPGHADPAAAVVLARRSR